MPSDGARLHPASIVLGIPLMQIVRALVVPALAVLAGRGGADGRTELLVLVVLALALVARVLAWSRFRWSFDGEVLRVEQGVLSRRRRVVAAARVQQVELDRPLVQRMLRLATLRIETAGSDAGPEVELRMLGLDEALALRTALQPDDARPGAHADVPDDVRATQRPVEQDVVLRLSAGRVALASVTGAQLLVAPALLAGLPQLAGDRSDELFDAAADWLGDVAAGTALPDPGVWLAGAGLLLVASIVTTVVVAIVRDGGFTIVRVGEDLVLRRGLLGTRESTVPLRRVQVVRVTANPLRRALGVASLRIHSAGGSAGGSGATSERRAVIPLVADTEIADLLEDLLPDLAGLPELRQHPPAAARRAMWRRLRGLVVWFAPASAGWVLLSLAPYASPVPLPGPVLDLLERDAAAWAVPLVVALASVALQLVLARLEYAALAHGLDARVIVARSGVLARTTSVAPLARLQGTTLRASWFQSRRGLATVRAHVAGPGGDVVVLDVGSDVAGVLQTTLAAVASGSPG